MTRRSSVGPWAIAWLLCALVGPLFTDPDAVARRAQVERVATQRQLDPLIRRLPFAMPDGPGAMAPVTRGAGPAGVRPVLQRVDRYATGLVRQWQAALVRAWTLGLWLLVLAPLVAATVVDGLAARAIRAATFGFQSPAAFSLARHTLVALGVLPVFALVWPASLPAAWAASGCLVALVPLRLALVHLPPIFSR